MKVLICLIATLLLLPSRVCAGKPNPAENEYLKIEGADIWTTAGPQGETVLVSSFLFELKKPLTLTRVRVEDVTTNPPVLLVDDKSPKIKNSKNEKFWTGRAPTHPLNAENYPWIFDGRDTRKKFRVTVSSKEAPDMVLEQGAQYDRREKAILVRMSAGAAKNKH
jgi:hypothetical protein